MVERLREVGRLEGVRSFEWIAKLMFGRRRGKRIGRFIGTGVGGGRMSGRKSVAPTEQATDLE